MTEVSANSMLEGQAGDPPIYGVVGLGAMGGGMAKALVDAKLSVCGVDPDPAARERARAAGVHTGLDLPELLGRSDFVVVCLATPSALNEVYDTIAGVPAVGQSMVIETSTMAPDRAQAFADISRASGRRHLEACLIGIARDAAAGRLYHFVGGQAADLDAAKGFLEATGRGHAHLGDIGSGAAAKVLNNAIGNATMLAFTEAIVAGETIGLDARAFVRAVSEAGGAGMSVVFDRHARWTTSDEIQPPNPINQKDMLEWGRMIGDASDHFAVLAEALQRFQSLPNDQGPVGAYADALRSALSARELPKTSS